MSGFSNRTQLRRLATVAAVVVACGASAAEMVDKSQSSGKSKPTPVESMARIMDNAPRSVLKCWQEGRLVFESSDVEAEVRGSAATLKGPNGRSLQLLDLRQGLCILERTNG